MSDLIAITIGDINGIGIHILLKSLKKKQIKDFVLFSNIEFVKYFLKKNKIKIRLNLVKLENKNNNYDKNSLNIYSYKSKDNEDNAYKSLKIAYRLVIKKKFIGIITLPIRKDLIKKNIDKNFIGHTEFFQKLDKKKNSNMILYHKKIIITPLTTHVSINKVSKRIRDKAYVYNQIINLNKSLKVDFNYKNPKIIISGLNPHAGENGQIGKEEINFIIPVINKLKKIGIKIDGPYSGDTLLINKNLKKYDCFIFIFHDQALIPFKYISQFSGVNYTGNLSIIRTSPDHGTAYKLIGSNNISNKSLLNCYKLVKKIYRNRMVNDST